MDDQQGLLFSSEPAQRGYLYYAVHPPAELSVRIAATVQRLAAQYGITGKPMLPERLHVSMQTAGVYDGSPVRLAAAARSAADFVRIEPFELRFDRVISFRNTRGAAPLVLVCDPGSATALAALHGALAKAMIRQGLKPEKAAFQPHMTLLWGRHSLDEPIEPLAWTVDEFALVHNRTDVPEQEMLGHWSLRGNAGDHG